MLHIQKLDDGLEVFKALGSSLRIQILKLLLERQEMNMNELAAALGITNGALTSHIRKLEQAGLIQVATEHGGHGNQKLCRVNVDKILIDVQSGEAQAGKNICETEVKIGHFTDCEIYPTCGLATTRAVIGQVDDPRSFVYPERVDAGILWFTRGYVEYTIPNLLPAGTKVDQITMSMEISSEAPGVNSDWPSEISFYLNDVRIGSWVSPGDYGDVRGLFTPDWWFPCWNQHGLLKMLTVNADGTFVDGRKISAVDIRQLSLDYRSVIRFRLQAPQKSDKGGGVTLFGSGFGNYGQDIQVRMACSAIS